MTQQPLIQVLLRHSSNFHRVVPFDSAKEKLLLLDFTKNNQEIFENIVDNTQKFSNYVNQKLQTAQARYGIGGYNEYRELYSRSKVFDSDDEPRRLHLGIDIWGRPYTAVMSPLDGIVHSFAFNNNFGDYGPTIILSHNLEGLAFHTLYGHLSLNSIKNLREGGNVKKGDVIGEFGIPMENGQWPPHLHFQIIIDIGEYRGDYPGVCKYSEKEKYLENCPDPDLILGMMKYVQ
ncbi:MAG TPA: peptidoglycan DD-metalloendopeptidase family protein [Chitinophagaceae bacterium]|jgi:murein DD-endopeptidase MepM/ murein hydrolase activator NlpD|nr:peptidoglycan DD-metalloendopeptidase family protein [Chitinophagaceae bacterium]